MAICVVLPGAAVAQPWHIGSFATVDQAPAAINSVNIQPGPATIVVAVIDSGVLGHASLNGAVLEGYDMVSAGANLRGGRSDNFAPDERNARCRNRSVSSTFRTHGTEVSSVIAGNGQDGMLGINPQARILPIRVFGACGVLLQDMIDAMLWAAGLPVDGIPQNRTPARVINISISGGNPQCSPALQYAIDTVVARDVLVVVAGGNNFQQPLAEPANCKGVISVGAISAVNGVESYTALDPRTTMYAPGGGQRIDTDAAWASNKIRVASYELNLFGQERAVVADKAMGTSFAAPVVAGYASLWLSHSPKKTLADWQAELPLFLRLLPSVEKCKDCVVRGLLINQKIFSEKVHAQ